MGSLMKEQVERFLREKKRHRRWLAIFLCLALLVSSGTFAMLRKNSQAMDGEGKVLKCEYQIHQHQDKCYDREGNLICGKADYAVHEHKENCYDKEGNLVCQIPERKAHVHDDSCYKEEKILVCGQEEATGHQHSQECYSRQQGQWICNLESHEHNENCYDGEGNLVCGMEAHQHGDQCYEWDEVLTCGQDETSDHIHGEECYQTEKVLICGELETHEHKDSCYEDGVLTCTVPELKEHVHGEECFRDASGVKDLEPESVSGNSDENGKTDEAGKFSYEDERVEISVTAADKGIVPEDAELSVKPILQQDVEALREDESVSENAVAEAEELNAKYEEVQRELEASVTEGGTKELAGFLAYDISFLAEQVNEETGETEKVEIEPDGNVEVSMRFADAYIPEMPEMPEKAASEEEGTETFSGNDENQAENFIVDVVHLKETPDDATGETKLDAEILDADIQKTDGAKVSEVTFNTDSFSTFTINWSITTPYGAPFPVQVAVNYWDAGTDKELEPDSDPGGIRLNGEVGDGYFTADSFDISDITQEGLRQKYYSITSGGKKYVFKGAYYVTQNERNSVSKIHLINGMPCCDERPIQDNGSIRFEYVPEGEIVEETGLKTVPTLDNDDYKIKMYMHDIDYDNSGISDALGGPWHKGYTSKDGKTPIGVETSGLVEKDLVDGFPVTSGYGNNQGISLKQWFSSGNPENDRVNHLFLQDRYNEDKTFYYSSYANYAYLDQYQKKFKVYDAIGTIFNIAESSPRCGFGGNFFPYNDIVVNKKSYLWNKFDKNDVYHEDWTIDENYTEKDKVLYRTQDNTNYHFGMYLETNFVQEPGGQITLSDGTKKDMVYEFTGDDDLWVFVNNRLVLDIGGVHDAVKGRINFATGEVRVGDLRNGESTTEESKVTKTSLQEIFKDKREYIEGSTLKEYEVYSLKIFYLERNGNNSAGGSTLRMAFNLPTIGEGEVQVKKQLSNSNDKYANIPFKFKLMAAPEKKDSATSLITYDNNVDKSEYVPITADAVNDRGEAIEFDPNDKTFKLKPGETATFSGISKQRKFYVVETGFEKDYYSSVSVNGTECTIEALTGSTGSEETLAKAETNCQMVGEGKRVIFTNNCSDANSNEIHITKALSGGVAGETESFDINVQLEATENEQLTPFTDDYYLIKEDSDGSKNYYKFDTDGKVVSADSEEPGKMIPCGKAQNGIVKIAPGYTVVIPKLPVGTDFKIYEDVTNLDKEKYSQNYQIGFGANDSCDKGEIENGIIASGSIKKSKNAEVTVTNYLNNNQGYVWQIIKKGTTKDTNPLEGAVFSLTSVDSPSIHYTGESGSGGIVTWTLDNADNKDNTGIIEKGTYILEETKAPAGHMLSDKLWRIVLAENQMSVTEVSDSDQTTGSTVTPTNPVNSTAPDGKTPLYEYTFLNTCIYELPSTGGDGIYRYLVSGIFLMMASTLILYKSRRKGVVGK